MAKTTMTAKHTGQIRDNFGTKASRYTILLRKNHSFCVNNLSISNQ